MSSLIKNTLLILFSLFIGLLVIEFGLRAKNLSGNNYDIEMWRYAKELKKPSDNPILGHEHVRSSSALLQNVEIRTNSFGMRGAEPLKSYSRRILFLGSSITLGWGVNESNVFTTLIKNKYKKDGVNVDILNAGIGNYNTERYVENFIQNLHELKPSDVVVHYFLNDAEILASGGGNYLTKHFQLAVLGWGAYQRIFGNSASLPMTKYYENLYSDKSEGIKRMLASLDKLNKYCQDRKINLYFSIVPDIHNLEAYPYLNIHNKLIGYAKERGIKYVDFLDSMSGLSPNTVWNLANDPHPNALGHKKMADQLYPVLN